MEGQVSKEMKFINTMEQCRAEVENLCEEFWQWRLKNFPEFATIVGFHKFDDRLNDLSLAGFEKRKLDAKNLENKVESLIQLHVERNFRIGNDLTILKSQLKTFVTGTEHQSHLCPLNRTDGLQFDVPKLLSLMKTETVEDFQKMLSRLSQYPKQLNQVIELLQEGIAKHHTMHDVSITPVVSQLKSLANEAFGRSPLAKQFQKRPSKIKTEDWEQIVGNAQVIITDEIAPMLFHLADFIAQQYIPQTRPAVGITSLPNGSTVYKACLQYHTSNDMTPEKLHELGKTETERIQQRMHEVKNKLNYGSIAELRDFLRYNGYYDGEDVMNHYKDVCNQIWIKLPDVFSTLPKENCKIEMVPKSQQHTSPFACYKEGTDNRPGIFFVNTADADKRSRHKAMALCLHEAIPGHHLQSDIILQQKSLPKFRKFIEGGSYQMIPGRFPLYTAFMEGWGLYSEFLGEELGLFENLPSLFGRLSSEMFRAVRLVIDTGIHAFQWSRAQAIDYLMMHVDFTYKQASSEIDRYITWPGQACSYKVGELKFHELRSRTRESLSGKFDVKEFHSVILRNGAVSLDFLEKTVDDYISFKIGKDAFV